MAERFFGNAFPHAERQGRLAVTARHLSNAVQASVATPHSAKLVDRVTHQCRSVIDGRRAARALGDWTRQFVISEAEFQVLWQLRKESQTGSDQTSLARELVFSAAQVSAIVERLRLRGFIAQQPASSDRRRNLWLLTESGRELLDRMLCSAGQLRTDSGVDNECDAPPRAREAAA